MKNKMKRFLLFCLICAVLTVFLSPTHVLAASKKSEQKAITKQMKKYLNAVQQYDTAKMIKYSYDSPTSWEYWKDPNMVKIARKVNQNYFEYEINKINIKGKTATVKIKYNYYDCSSELDQALEEALQWYLVYKNTNKFLKKVREYFFECYSYDGRLEDEELPYSCTVTLTKKNGSWQITKIPKKFYKAIDGGTVARMKYFYNNIQKYL